MCVVIVWLAFTLFTVYSGSPGVLLTDAIMFMVFLLAALIAVPFIVHAVGGWFNGIAALANCESVPGIISLGGNPGCLYPDGASNLAWSVTYGIVWALVVAISPWQKSRYLMARDERVVLRSSVWSSMGMMTVTAALYFSAAFIRVLNGGLNVSEALIWAAMNVLPPVIGVTLLIGISAAGISSASTFLSLIGFSVVNDIAPQVYEDDRKKLRLSRASMLTASLVILVLACLNPPQIFIIMYFGVTVIASSWSIAAFGSVWSRRLSKTGAYLDMLLGFVGCAVAKVFYSAADYVPTVWLDPFFIGMLMSGLGAVLGSVLAPRLRKKRQSARRFFTSLRPRATLRRIVWITKCGSYICWFRFLWGFSSCLRMPSHTAARCIYFAGVCKNAGYSETVLCEAG